MDFCACVVKLGNLGEQHSGNMDEKTTTYNPTDTEVAHFSLCDTEKQKRRKKKYKKNNFKSKI